MRQARQRIAKGGSVIRTSVSTFMEFIGNNPNAFRLLLRERSGHLGRVSRRSRA
ncbi:TetR family transcriptional regulator [Citrobacter koseri]|uniref:TetR family transcriptional regulator n=1 Tax=Citrobacter koseri TaxID=545 RepID=A0A3S4IB49_CITKO|nr:TetR family transcriptional regulator [Citrobacter koseri]